MSSIDCPPESKRTHRNAILSELRELQGLAMDDVRNSSTLPAVRAQLMRAYVELQKQRNVERMRPAPKPVDVQAVAPRASGYSRTRVRRIAPAAQAAVVAAVAPAAVACATGDARDSSPSGDAPLAASEVSDAPACAMDASVSAPAKR